MKTNNCPTAKQNFLTSSAIDQVLLDESMDGVGRVVKLAIISLYGPDAPRSKRERALIIGKASEAANKDLKEGSLGGYPKGFLGAYLNSSLNNSLKGTP